MQLVHASAVPQLAPFFRHGPQRAIAAGLDVPHLDGAWDGNPERAPAKVRTDAEAEHDHVFGRNGPTTPWTARHVTIDAPYAFP